MNKFVKNEKTIDFRTFVILKKGNSVADEFLFSKIPSEGIPIQSDVYSLFNKEGFRFISENYPYLSMYRAVANTQITVLQTTIP